MRLLISVDIEGVAGVSHPSHGQMGNGEYELARRLMTQEANAAIKGALAGGATEVIVNDSHGDFRNLLPQQLHSQARLLNGRPRALGMVAGVPLCQALMLVGYHAKAQAAGILSHTISGKSFARIQINGVEFGEAALYGSLAGEFGAPVLMCSGDDVFAAETQPLLPGTAFVVTKQALGQRCALHLSPEASCAAIEAGARAAMAAHLQQAVAPVRVLPGASGAIVCRVQAQSVALADLFSILPLVERVSGSELEFSGPDMHYVVRVLNTLSAMGMGLN
jgi:D-amino peptidase